MTLKLLVGYGGTETDRRALAYIAPLVKDPTVELSLLVAGHAPDVAGALFDEASELLGQDRFERVTTSASLPGALLEAARARPYDLVVFGHLNRRLRWPFRRRALSLSALLPVSSLMVRGEATRIANALICTGGDESVIALAQLTARLARRTGARATILHVLSQVPMLFGRGVDRERVTEALASTGAPEMKHMRAAAEKLHAGGVEASIKVRVGLVVEEITAELVEGSYDLLVIGAHRSTGLVERLLLEDVAADILPQSPVPVLVGRATP